MQLTPGTRNVVEFLSIDWFTTPEWPRFSKCRNTRITTIPIKNQQEFREKVKKLNCKKGNVHTIILGYAHACDDFGVLCASWRADYIECEEVLVCDDILTLKPLTQHIHICCCIVGKYTDELALLCNRHVSGYMGEIRNEKCIRKYITGGCPFTEQQRRLSNSCVPPEKKKPFFRISSPHGMHSCQIILSNCKFSACFLNLFE
jgi:hypothetical protein